MDAACFQWVFMLSPVMKRRLPVVVVMSLFVLGSAGCASEPNDLADHLGQPLEDVPGIVDAGYVLSLTQDERLGSVPRSFNQVEPSDKGWVVSAICSDTPTIDPAVTENLTIRVVSEDFVTEDILRELGEGDLQDGVVCGNEAPVEPELD